MPRSNRNDENTKEETKKEEKIESNLLELRRLFLSDAVDNDSATDIIKKIWYLEKNDPGKPILFVINSPGGSVDAGFAVWDQLKLITSPVTTLVTGLAASMGSVLGLVAGKGRRFATPLARFMIHQPSIGGVIQGQATDLEIQAKEILKTREQLVQIYVQETGKDAQTIRNAIDRDTWLTAKEALDFGLLDGIASSYEELKKKRVMLGMIPFSKYSGSGNDFILIDNRKGVFNDRRASLIVKMCDRKNGIGADGVILLESSQKCDFRMRIFNPDGTEAEMCGNGIRCLAKFIEDLNIDKSVCRIETLERELGVVKSEGEIKVEMGDPKDMEWDIPIEVLGESVRVHYLNTGVPHVVYFVRDLDEIDCVKMGSKLRYHPRFQPKGTNVNFVMVDKNNELWIRTYERGVEGETLACGTGAVASALAASKIYGLKGPLRVHPVSDEVLVVHFQGFSKVTLTGPARLCFTGQYSL